MGAEIISTKPKRCTLKSVKDGTMGGLGSVIKLFPTGTIFLYQFLMPLLSNYGECGSFGNINMTRLLIFACGVISTFSCFTDSYFGIDGEIHYGIVTSTGIWPGKASGMADLSQYKLRPEDFVYATFSALLFGSLTFTDKMMVLCFHDSTYWKDHKSTLMAVPVAIGLISSFLFVIFPNKRHGIGYPSDGYPDIDEE